MHNLLINNSPSHTLSNIIEKTSKKQYVKYYLMINSTNTTDTSLIQSYLTHKNINYELVSEEQLYLIMKSCNYFPKITIDTQNDSINKKTYCIAVLKNVEIVGCF